MKLIFAGTRGYIDLRSLEHKRHSVLALEYRGRTALIDCGEDWLDHLDELVQAFGQALGVRASIATDGLELMVRS